MSLPTPEARMERELAHYEADLFWVLDNYDALRSQYANRFVAVLDKRVVAYATAIEQLTEQLRAQRASDFHRIVFEFVYERHPNFVLGV